MGKNPFRVILEYNPKSGPPRTTIQSRMAKAQPGALKFSRVEDQRSYPTVGRKFTKDDNPVGDRTFQGNFDNIGEDNPRILPYRNPEAEYNRSKRRSGPVKYRPQRVNRAKKGDK